MIDGYVIDYNENRLHSALQYLAPADYLRGNKRIRQCLERRKEKLKEAARCRQFHADLSLKLLNRKLLCEIAKVSLSLNPHKRTSTLWQTELASLPALTSKFSNGFSFLY